jgi:hypothetical protein
VHDLSRCGYTDDGHAPSSQAAPGRLPGRPTACQSRPHIYSFLLVRIPRPVPRVYWPLVLGLRQAQRGHPTPLDAGAVPGRLQSRQSTVTVSLGRAVNSFQVQKCDWPTAPSTVNSHRSNRTLGVGPADSTGKSLSTYCPGGTRAASTSMRRRP